MKILLDECVTKHLKSYLGEHVVSTVREMNWGGIKNGKLMTLCVQHNFEVLLTIDKNLQHQQNLDKYPLAIVILNTTSSKIDELVLFLPKLKVQLLKTEKHKAYLIDK